MKPMQLQELLLQSLEHERGGVKIYRTALKCALRKDLSKEWTEYLTQTEKHVEVLTAACTSLGIDPGTQTPGCKIVRDMGLSLIEAMDMALAAANPPAAQIVACECVVLAETKDHADWELIGLLAKSLPDEQAQVLQHAYDQVEDEEDEHLYHTKGWCRELWLESLGVKAELPPAEEKEQVKSAMDAARTKKQRAARQ
jgi:rubrerythrin